MKQDPQTEQKGQLINNQCFFFMWKCFNATLNFSQHCQRFNCPFFIFNSQQKLPITVKLVEEF